MVFLCFGLSVIAQNTLVHNDVQAYFHEARTLGNKNQIDLALKFLDKAAALAEENKDVKTVAAFEKRGLKSANPNPFC